MAAAGLQVHLLALAPLGSHKQKSRCLLGVILGCSVPQGQAECYFSEAFAFLKAQKSIHELVSTKTPDGSGQRAQKCWYLC